MAEVHYDEESFTDGRQNEGYSRHTKLLYKQGTCMCDYWTHDCVICQIDVTNKISPLILIFYELRRTRNGGRSVAQ